MRSKLFSALLLLPALALPPARLSAQTPAPEYLGEPSCSSSSCHGGAGEKRGQCLVWSKRDFHTRSFATLTTARSARLADSLQIADPARNERCTVCHAPFLAVNPARLAPAVDPALGVSCESCHGPARDWLRSHTRSDFTRADRVRSGMRDLQNLYVRANSCVACHQNVDSDILAAGHPELLFELDGQSVSEPKHWRESKDGPGPQAWLVGQAVALRESSWQLSREKAPAPNAVNRWLALVWLMRKIGPLHGVLPESPAIPPDRAPENVRHAQEWADKLARSAADAKWSNSQTRDCLVALAGTARDFYDASVSAPNQARRAERLVLALDRLVSGLESDEAAKALNEPLNRLFKQVQSLPDFKPEEFAADLDKFQKAVTARISGG